MKRTAKAKKQVFTVAFLAAAVLVAIIVVSPYLAPLSMWVSPGWEIYNQVGAIRSNDVILSQESQFTSPKELMGNYWKVDVDDPWCGIPTIMVECGDIRHVDFTGETLPSDQPARSMTVTRGNWTAYLDYHIYMETITIRTIADDHVNWTDPINGMPMFAHETHWASECWSGTSDLGRNVYVGKEFVGGAYVKFVISPWRGYSYRTAPGGAPEGSYYTLGGCWAGVMNTYVFQKTQGQVNNQWGQMPAVTDLYIGGGIDQGNQVPMFADDGTFGTAAPTVPWDTQSILDTRIASTTVDYLPINMWAGSYVTYNWAGMATGLAPADVAVQYTLRIDVLQTHNFTLQTGVKPPDVTWPTDYFGWAQSFWTGVLGGLNPFAFLGPFSPLAWFLVSAVIGLIVILVLIAVFAPWALPRIFGGMRQARDFAYKSIEKRPRRKSGSRK